MGGEGDGGEMVRSHSVAEVQTADPDELLHLDAEPARLLRSMLDPSRLIVQLELETLRRKLDVEPSHTVAMGDGRNDIEMLDWAARGVAMGQAPEEVAAVAHEITGTVEEDGAAAVLRSLLD